MWTVSRACWQSFVDWLGFGVSGVLPDTLRRTVGPVGLLLPLARQAAAALGPWLLSLLAERQRAGRASLAPANERQAEQSLAEDAETRPLTWGEARCTSNWLAWLLEAELARLARLIEAPTRLFYRPDWPAPDVRYWALVVCLARLAQLYAVLERRQGRQTAGRLWAEAAERVWQQIAGEPEAA
jgi:hypothetical protein